MTPALSRFRKANNHEIVRLGLSAFFFRWGDSMNTVSMPRRHPGRDSLVTAAEIAERWQVHRDTVYRIPESELPSVKLGPKTRRYRWADVVAYEAACLMGGT